MAFRFPKSMESVISENKPDYVITMGCSEACPAIPGARILDWDLPDPAGKPVDFMRDVRDEIEKRVDEFIGTL